MKTRNLNLFIAVLLLFCSCASQKYNHYFTTLKPTEPNVQELFSPGAGSRWNDLYQKAVYPNRGQADSCLFYMYMFDNHIDINYSGNIGIYVDSKKTSLEINDSIWNIEYKQINSEGIEFLEKDSDPDLTQGFAYSNFSIQKLVSAYQVYTNDTYKKVYYDYSKKKYPTIKFTEQNTPLRLKFKVVYYTDKNLSDMHTTVIDLYQSALVRVKGRASVEYKVDKVDLSCSFYSKQPTGKVWGWPEIRKGLGWTTTIICLPITFPIDLISTIGSNGDSTAPIPIPLFE